MKPKKMVIDNICYVLNNYLQCTEYENVIFSWVMHEQTIQKRLLNDINHGLRTMDVIERSIEKIPMYKNLSTIKIDTSNQSVDETAQAIINIIY